MTNTQENIVNIYNKLLEYKNSYSLDAPYSLVDFMLWIKYGCGFGEESSGFEKDKNLLLSLMYLPESESVLSIVNGDESKGRSLETLLDFISNNILQENLIPSAETMCGFSRVMSVDIIWVKDHPDYVKEDIRKIKQDISLNDNMNVPLKDILVGRRFYDKGNKNQFEEIDKIYTSITEILDINTKFFNQLDEALNIEADDESDSEDIEPLQFKNISYRDYNQVFYYLNSPVETDKLGELEVIQPAELPDEISFGKLISVPKQFDMEYRKLIDNFNTDINTKVSELDSLYDVIFKSCYITPPLGAVYYIKEYVNDVSEVGYYIDKNLDSRMDNSASVSSFYGSLGRSLSSDNLLDGYIYNAKMDGTPEDIVDTIYTSWRTNPKEYCYFPKFVAQCMFGVAWGAKGYEATNLIWDNYKNIYVKPVLYRILQDVIYKYALDEGLIAKELYRDGKRSAVIKDLSKYAQKCLSVAIILLRQSYTIDNELLEYYVRVSDPARKLCRKESNLDSKFYTSVEQSSGNCKIINLSAVYADVNGLAFTSKEDEEDVSRTKPIHKETKPIAKYGVGDNVKSLVVDFRDVMNFDAVESVPVFAYKEVKNNIKNAYLPILENLPLGRGADGMPVVNGMGAIKMTDNIVHYMIAGSRSGKGVNTLGFLAAAMLNRRGVIYLDNKPDMVSSVISIADDIPYKDVFLLNGGKLAIADDVSANKNVATEITYDPETNEKIYNRPAVWAELLKSDVFASNHLDQLLDTNDRPIIPKYVVEVLGSNWQRLGNLIYFRALSFVMGIAWAFTASNYEKCKTYLSAANITGLTVVVDEVNNFKDGFTAIINSLINHLPPSDEYISNYTQKVSRDKTKFDKTIEEKKKKGEDVSNEVFKSKEIKCIAPSNYYAEIFLRFFDQLASSYKDRSQFGGSGNSLAEKLDIFVIGQTPSFQAPDLKPESIKTQVQMALSKRLKGADNDPDLISGRVNPSNLLSKIEWGDRALGLLDNPSVKSDLFLGYNTNNPNILAMKDSSSPASSYLNAKSRYFAYKNEVHIREDAVGEIWDDLVHHSKDKGKMLTYANNITYYKPYLILNANIDKYTDGVLKVAHKDAKLPLKTIFDAFGDEESQNLVRNATNGSLDSLKEDSLRFHDGVGLEGYLDTVCDFINTDTEYREAWKKKAGMDIPSNASECLNISLRGASNLAKGIIQMMGYPCTDDTWFYFFLDMRPEWLFTPEDISNIWLGENLDKVTIEAYQRSRHRSDWDSFVESTDPEIRPYMWRTLLLKEKTPDFYKDEFAYFDLDAEHGAGFHELGMEDVFRNTLIEDPTATEAYEGSSENDTDRKDSKFIENMSLAPNEPQNRVPNFASAGSEAPGSNTATKTSQGSSSNSTGQNTATKSSQGIGSNSTGPNTTSRGTEDQEGYEQGEIASQTSENGRGALERSQALSPVQKRKQEILATPNPQVRPPQILPQDSTSVKDYKRHRNDIEMLSDIRRPGTPVAIYIEDIANGDVLLNKDVMPILTKAVLAEAGGIEGLRRFAVTAQGYVVVNGKRVVPQLSENSPIECMSVSLVQAIEDGNIAEYIDYRILSARAVNLEYVIFEDASFADNYVTPFLHMPDYEFDVAKMFKIARSMKYLVLGEQMYNRSTYKKVLAEEAAEDESGEATVRKSAQFFDNIGDLDIRVANKGWELSRKSFSSAWKQFTTGHIFKSIGSVVGGLVTGVVAGVTDLTGTAVRSVANMSRDVAEGQEMDDAVDNIESFAVEDSSNSVRTRRRRRRKV